MLLVTAGGMAVSALATQVLSKGWQKVFKEEPPVHNTSDHIDWKKVALWSALTAGVVTTVELATRRSLSVYLDKHLPG